MILSAKTFENVLIPGVNSQDLELTTDQRKALFEHMDEYGMSRSTAYNRIFRQGFGSGFEQWELHGVLNVVQDFCKEKGIPAPTDAELPTWYLEQLEGYRAAFCDYVQPLGISKVTCLYRFKNWNFKPWELIGVRGGNVSKFK